MAYVQGWVSKTQAQVTTGFPPSQPQYLTDTNAEIATKGTPAFPRCQEQILVGCGPWHPQQEKKRSRNGRRLCPFPQQDPHQWDRMGLHFSLSEMETASMSAFYSSPWNRRYPMKNINCTQALPPKTSHNVGCSTGIHKPERAKGNHRNLEEGNPEVPTFCGLWAALPSLSPATRFPSPAFLVIFKAHFCCLSFQLLSFPIPWVPSTAQGS